MNEISGLIVAPMWRAFMDIALKKVPEERFSEPPRTPDTLKPVLRGVWFDPSALISPDEDTNEGVPALSLENTIASAHDILYFVDKDDPRGPAPVNPESDPQFTLWEYPVTIWKTELLGVAKEEEDSDRPSRRNSDD
jgi:hypothetical protein